MVRPCGVSYSVGRPQAWCIHRSTPLVSDDGLLLCRLAHSFDDACVAADRWMKFGCFWPCIYSSQS